MVQERVVKRRREVRQGNGTAWQEQQERAWRGELRVSTVVASGA